MKKYVLTFIVLMCSIFVFAQGIAVQGIARDNSLSAITDQTLTFTFNITKSDNTVLYSETQGIKTDNFGIFSHIVSTGNPTGNAFSSIDFQLEDLKLKVFVNYNNSDIEVYDQPFYYTPYAHFAKKAALATNATNATNAINADDGVPTGAIAPYVGNSAPEGWVLCNGQSLTNIAGSEALRNIIGDYAPDLRGMFLRGTGQSPVNNQSGPSLNTTQGDTYKSHAHNKGSLSTATGGSHTHDIKKLPYDQSGSGVSQMTLKNSDGSDENWANVQTTPPAGSISTNGNHTHTITGSTATSGGSETRPVNYGVNYIIKL